MPSERKALRDWHRLFGLLLTDLFADSPFVVEIERDTSLQQQFLDVVIVRRGKGEFVGRLPDGLEGLRAHNLITFKSHRESLDPWAMKELIGHYVAYRKLVRPKLLPEDQFGLYAISARFPQALAGQVPWKQLVPGVYDCQWGADVIRVIVARELERQAHNAPLHLFSRSTDGFQYGSQAYQRRSPNTSGLLIQLFEGYEAEGLQMPFTMEDFQRQFVKDHFPKLARKDREDILKTVSPEEFLAGRPAEDVLAKMDSDQILAYVDRLAAKKGGTRKPKRKK